MHTPDIDRLMAEADRRADDAREEAWRHREALLREFEPDFDCGETAGAWHYALTRLAAILAVGAALLALAGVLAVLP